MKLLISVSTLALATLAVAQPTTNPVRGLFPEAFAPATNLSANVEAYTWTDDLPWTRITTTAATPNDGNDDLATVQAEIDALSAGAGGVLYFPAGTYHFSNDLVVRTGVILRGADLSGVTDARQEGFLPPTSFVFPRYVFDTATLTPADSRAARTSAFKVIRLANATTAQNAGLVNLDIQRARVDFIERTGVWGSSDKNILESRNLLLFGLRINNAVSPEGVVPVATKQNNWQIYTDRRQGKIEVMALANAMVANCRLSDLHYRFYVQGDTSAAIDDFRFPMIGTDKTTVYVDRNNNFLPQAILTAIRDFPNAEVRSFYDGFLRFNYSAGYGIKMNRSGATGYTSHETATGIPEGANPVYEPSLFRRGLVCRNNWVFNWNRVAYHVAGDGLEVRGNVKTDHRHKIAFVPEDGQSWKTNSSTHECRAIDVTGYNLIIEENDLHIEREKLAWSWRTSGGFQYLTTDGEGILLQQSGGGTGAVGWKVNRNRLRGTGYIGLYKMPVIDTVEIVGNDISIDNTDVTAIFLVALQTGEPGSVRRTLVADNIIGNGGSITFTSPIAMAEVEVRNNRLNGSIFYEDYGIDIATPNDVFYVHGNTNQAGTGPATLVPRLWSGGFPSSNTIFDRPFVTSFTLTPSTYAAGEVVRVRATVQLPPVSEPIDYVRFYDGTTMGPAVINTQFDINAPGAFVPLADTDGDGTWEGDWTVPATFARGLPSIAVLLQPQQVFEVPNAGTATVHRERWYEIYRKPVVAPPTGPVRPIVKAAQVIAGQLRLRFVTEPGVTYQVQGGTSLAGDWENQGTAIVGDGTEKTFDLTPPANPTVYFSRVAITPPVGQ